ncbi:MAG: hypothetical protein ABWY23_01975 [Mycetocola sp.]
MRRRWTTPLLVAACAVVLPALAACAVPASAGLPDGVTVDVLQGRTDYTSGTLVIRIVNESAEELLVSSASLDAPGFAEPATWDRGTTVRAGTTVDLRAAVPEQDCTQASGRPRVELTTGAGDRRTTVTVEAADPLGTLERLHGTGCIATLVDRVAQISVGPPVVEGVGTASVAVLPLSLAPTGADGSVETAGIGSTPLLRPAQDAGGDGNGWPVTLTVDAASAPVTVPLRIVPARCDPHAIAEDKIGTVLVISVTLSDGSTGDYRVTPPEDIREALLDFVREHCGMA